MVPLVTLVKYGRTDCLSHKLCEKLLERKWALYGLPLHLISTGIYSIFLFALTFIITFYPNCDEFHANNMKNISNCKSNNNLNVSFLF
jgi:hypothetical protein